MASGEPLIVEDARTVPPPAGNRAIDELGVISYLGVPVRSPNGHVLGSLCAIGTVPRQWSALDVQAMSKLAAIAEDHVAMRNTALNAQDLAEQNDTLAHEYHHRVKNALAVSAALVKLTARTASSVDDLVAQATPRLMALASAHDELMTESDNVDLQALVSRLLLPYGTPGSAADAQGPAVVLKNSQVTSICLVVHELATNSAKYGAFRDAASVVVRWHIRPNRTVHMAWTEEATASSAPDKGFGTKLIEAAARQLRARSRSHGPHPILECCITFPLATDQ